MKQMRDWIKRNQRLIALKVAIGFALIVTHYYPSDMSWVVNLLWLFLF